MNQQQPATGKHQLPPRKCWMHNWVEERTVASLGIVETKQKIQKHGHRGILTLDQDAKMETVTTSKADYSPPKNPRGPRDARRERLAKHSIQAIRERNQAELNPPTPKTDFSSTSQRDFNVEGFVPLTPKTTQTYGCKTNQAITFWSDNRQWMQGMTAVKNPTAPFRRSAQFSTPISERLDEIDLPPDH